MDDQRRFFSEKEASDLVKRAAEIASKQDTSDVRPGVSQEELEKLALELGIPKEAIGAAIREKAIARPNPVQIAGELEVVIEGELNPADFSTVFEVAPLQQGTQPARVGKRLEYSTFIGMNNARIIVTSRNGRTKIQVKPNPWMGLLFGFSGFFPLMVILLTSKHFAFAPGVAALVVSLFAAAILAAGLVYNNHCKKFGLKLIEDLREHLVSEMTTGGIRSNLTHTGMQDSQDEDRHIPERF